MPNLFSTIWIKWDVTLINVSWFLVEFLLDLRDVKKHRKRKGYSNDKEPSWTQKMIFVPLGFAFGELGDFSISKGFQRLLWYNGMHFDSCFDTGQWTKDERGIYCRSDVLVDGLTHLSALHNELSEAMKNLKEGNQERWWAKVGTAFKLHQSIVRTHHHRQFPDLLAKGVLLEQIGRHESSGVRSMMTRHLYEWAKLELPSNDPRRNMFQELMSVDIDRKGHIFLAFDAYCHHLWFERAGGGDFIKAYYGYNQASMPRAVPGAFFAFFRERRRENSSQPFGK